MSYRALSVLCIAGKRWVISILTFEWLDRLDGELFTLLYFFSRIFWHYSKYSTFIYCWRQVTHWFQKKKKNRLTALYYPHMVVGVLSSFSNFIVIITLLHMHLTKLAFPNMFWVLFDILWMPRKYLSQSELENWQTNFLKIERTLKYHQSEEISVTEGSVFDLIR